MSHYKSNVRDIEFNLFEVFGTDKTLQNAPFDEVDEDTARGIIAEVAKLAEGPLAASFVDADRNPPVFDPDTYSVTIPESFKKSYKTLQDSEWWRLETIPELGGQQVPRTVVWAVAEQVLGSNPALHMYMAGAPFAGILYANGNDVQKKMAQLMVDRGWGATMVLTEPDAGSDVGAGKTKAIEQADGSWHIEGVKRFITSAEQDMTENIIHLVLARPEGAKAGTKGLSLFVVPKFHFDAETGELGERNGAFVTNVEHKMGLKASTTCELRFGEIDNIPAQGWLVGDVHEGIAQMFQVIEHARMMVGTKAIATLSTGYLNALEYAKTRVQSADLTKSGDKTAPRVPIINHPDVRRSLMQNKAYAEGLRALVYYTASAQDRIIIGEHTGADTAADVAINDLLLPIVKGAGSERSYDQLAQALQTFGGSGYLQDYPLEQYIRDAKIDTLYEGNHGDPGPGLLLPQDREEQGRRAGRAVHRDHPVPRVDRRRGPAQGRGCGSAEGPRGLRRHRRCDVPAADERAGGHRQRLQGRAERHAPADLGRRPDGRLPAAEAGFGRADQARRQRSCRRPIAPSMPASPRWPASSPPPCCPSWPLVAPWPRPWTTR